MREVVFYTDSSTEQLSKSDQLLARAFAERGIAVTSAVWHQGALQQGCGLVRSTWDYPAHFKSYETWLANTAGTLVNSPKLVRWNLDKTYLLELQSKQVSVVHSALLDDVAAVSWSDITAMCSSTDVVFKPRIGNSGKHVNRIRSEAEFMTLHYPGGAIVQPFQEEIFAGEVSLIFINGTHTHGIVRLPHGDDFRANVAQGATVEQAVITSEEIAVAKEALLSLPEPAFYARVDGVRTRTGFLVMEIEVAETGLFFTHAPKQVLDSFVETFCAHVQ